MQNLPECRRQRGINVFPRQKQLACLHFEEFLVVFCMLAFALTVCCENFGFDCTILNLKAIYNGQFDNHWKASL